MSTRKSRLAVFTVAVAVLIATPLALWASDPFGDVPDSNVHHDDITWLADAGVTFGCNPPDNTEFCPGDPVLRQQMASFMRRLAENQVVDAATAIEADLALDVADGAVTDDKLADDLQPRWATVHHDGSLVRGRAATESDKVGTSEFSYEVVFDRDVSECAYAATLTEITGGDMIGIVSASPMAGNSNAVIVVTRDHEGTGAARSFHLTVTC